MLNRTMLLAATLTVLQIACSSGSSSDVAPGSSTTDGSGSYGGSAGGSGIGGATQAGGQSSQGGSSSTLGGNSSTTQNCPLWPKEKLFPLTGLFFYGPNPGPCSITSSGVTKTFSYDTSNRPIRLANPDNTDVTTYTYDQALLVSALEVTTTAQLNTTYTYSGNIASYTNSNASGLVSQYTYTLDAQGYPQTITAQGPVFGAYSPTRYQNQYDNCRLSERLAYFADNTESSVEDTSYAYDSLGRIIERKSTTFDEIYDYSCW
jgi:YD repeat-containing protein